MSAHPLPAPLAQISGRNHAIVSGHILATQAADAVLRDGGNAFDAALAGAAVLCIALPHACGLGGDCFALVRHQGSTLSLNGSGPSPRGLPVGIAPAELFEGPASCAVPGMVAGWHALHERFASRPWATLMLPAAALARDGIEVSDDFAQSLRLFGGAFNTDPALSSTFLRDGTLPLAGQRIRRPESAAAFEALAATGARGFYDGEWGNSLCEAVQRRGGFLDRTDLAGFRAGWSKPLEYEYRGHTVQVAPPNSFGLYMLLQLAALADSGIEKHGLLSPGRLALLMRAARAAFAAGAGHVADPRSATVDARAALAPDAVAALRASMLQSPSPGEFSKSQGTAVISVVDSAGNAITLVQSIFKPFGSMVCDPATGILLNNRLAGFSTQAGHPNCPAPSKLPAHTLNPVMVTRAGRLRYLLGTPGGSGQTITLTHVLSALLDLGIPLARAVAAPRWSMDLKGGLLIEPELVDADPGEDLPGALAALGLPVTIARNERFFFGSAECIEIDAESHFTPVADHRRDAAAIVA